MQKYIICRAPPTPSPSPSPQVRCKGPWIPSELMKESKKHIYSNPPVWFLWLAYSMLTWRTQQTPKPLAQEPAALPPNSVHSDEVKQVPLSPVVAAHSSLVNRTHVIRFRNLPFFVRPPAGVRTAEMSAVAGLERTPRTDIFLNEGASRLAGWSCGRVDSSGGAACIPKDSPRKSAWTAAAAVTAGLLAGSAAQARAGRKLSPRQGAPRRRSGSAAAGNRAAAADKNSHEHNVVIWKKM